MIIAVNFPILAIGKKKPEKKSGFFSPIAKIGKFTAMIILHFQRFWSYKKISLLELGFTSTGQGEREKHGKFHTNK